VKVALVDDDQRFLTLQQEYVERFSREEGVPCNAISFTSGFQLMDGYTGTYDAVFLDIEMPGMNGLETAQMLRTADQSVCIVFVTNMAQYAIRGYAVNALDFVVKPIEYFTFADKLKKVLRYRSLRPEREALLSREGGLVRVPYSQIYYLEKDKNYLIYHTQQGAFRERGTVLEKEPDFLDCGFARCTSGCLVNLQHVRKTSRDTVLVGEDTLPLSRQHRKPFVDSLMKYLGGAL
jgi:putative two-component response regulator